MEASSSNLVAVHPNQERSSSQATKAIIVGLLIANAALTLLIFVGGFTRLEGMKIVVVIYIGLYLGMAYLVHKWSRGTLAMASGAAVLFLSVSVLAVPTWFSRSKVGFDSPLLPSALLGLLTIALVFLQIALIVFAMLGFSQQWNIEVEVSEEEAEGGVDPRKFDQAGQRVDHDDEDEDDQPDQETEASGDERDEDEDEHRDGSPQASSQEDGGQPSRDGHEDETAVHETSASDDGDERSGHQAERSGGSSESQG